MMKWLRTHKKQIMVIVVLFAMFSFVGGSALYDIMRPDPSKDVIMELFDREVTRGELAAARSDTEILENIFIPGIWKYHPTEELAVQDWLMLAEEAERADIVIPDERIDAVIAQVEQFRSLDRLREQRGYSLSRIRRALGRHLAIQRNARRVAGAGAPSEPQLRQYVRDTQDKVQVKFVPLDANNFTNQDETIPDETMQAHFDRYKNDDPEESATGFGYRHPRRVKIQYVVASINDLQSQIEVSLDEIKTFWKGKDGQGRPNKEKYKKTVYVDPPQPTSAASQPVEKPKPIPEQRVKTFTEARPDVKNELKKRKAMKVSRQMMNKLADELAGPWNELRIDEETRYKPIPAGVEKPGHMKSVLQNLEKRFGVSLQYEETDFLSKAELEANPTLGNADTPGEGTDYLKAAELAFRVPSFFEVDPEKLTQLRLQMFQSPNSPFVVAGRSYQFTGGQLTPTRGAPVKYVLFRVIETQEVGAAASLAEVRDEVERDLRLVKAFDAMETDAKEFYAVARRLGLDAALPLFSDLREKGVKAVSKPAAFARWDRLAGDELQEMLGTGESSLATAAVPGVGKSKEFVEACFEMAKEGWSAAEMDLPETERTKDAAGKPVADPAPKVRLVSIPKLKKWFIIELVRDLPVNSETYENQHRTVAFQALQSDRSSVLLREWFHPDNIHTRCAFRRVDSDPGQDATSEGGGPPPPVRF
ncbi:MAG: SurA N-terminal domain-containing protein [Phycisphaerales bacterium]|nr:SurA N-terminal domain-containing protein [Phycisphaerales bacterium]